MSGRYARLVEAAPRDRLRSAAPLARLALALFVLAWVFDVADLRATVPIWLPFLLALGLELNFFVGARRARARRPDRLPQDVDVEPGFDDLLLVRTESGELWIPYAGETGEELEELVAEARERVEAEAESPPVYGIQGPSTRSLLAGLAIIAALAALVWVVDSRSGWNGVDPDDREQAEARFSAEASRIAGHPVTIRCDTSGRHVGAVQHSDGIAEVGGRIAYLTPDRCLDLYRLTYEDRVSDSQTGRSIAVLAHEAWHLRGVRNEAVTECYALQSGVDLGRRLGLSDGTARRMMRQQLAENALRTGSSAEYRVPGSCKDGGRLDLHPGSSSFP
jgi:hypothetical protein